MQHSKRTLYQRWARCLIACYPACWRRRYAEEMLLIVEDSPPTLKTIVNLFLSLFDAHLNRNIMKEGITSMLRSMRSNELAIYSSALIFFVPWMFVRGHFMDFAPTVLFPGLSSADPLPTNITRSVSYLLPFLILLGGLPILLAACWQSLKERKIRTLLFCFLGLISPLVTMIIAWVGISPIGRTFFLPFSFVVGLVLSLALITSSVNHVTPSRRVTHYALSLATVIPLVMLLGLATLLPRVIPSLITLFQAGDIFYVLRTDLLILIMLGAFFFSLLSLKKGFQARQALQEIAD